jgi:sugar phosphate isomerase/epimerase
MDQYTDMRIGTLVRCNRNRNPLGVPAYIKQIIPHGFESLQLFWWQTLDNADLPGLADEVKEAVGTADVTVPTLAMFGNPLGDTEIDRQTHDGWVKLIDHAHLFGAKVIAGFTGRVRNKPLPESLPRFREIWGELAKRAADKGVRIAFENCPMLGTWQTGDWNIAHNPVAWEMMFNEVTDDALGLEWEPCHQLYYLIDPLPQLRHWMPKIYHVHGKDASVDWDLIRSQGIHGPDPFAYHRTPGFGDTNWVDVISALRKGGYPGSIDIEGWHDPVYRDELEMTGQVHSLNYLKRCRGGAYVTNPA